MISTDPSPGPPPRSPPSHHHGGARRCLGRSILWRWHRPRRAGASGWIPDQLAASRPRKRVRGSSQSMGQIPAPPLDLHEGPALARRHRPISGVSPALSAVHMRQHIRGQLQAGVPALLSWFVKGCRLQQWDSPSNRGADYRLSTVQYPSSTLSSTPLRESQRCERKHLLSSWHSAAQ